MIPLSIPEITGKEILYIKECLDSGWLSSAGPYVKDFEDRFKEYVGAKFAIATINGTSALHLALMSMGIGQGDEVIVPSLTFAATVNAIKYIGAEPVFVDVCRDTYVMDSGRLEELISNKTKAIMPVHLHGQPVEMDEVIAIAHKYGLKVVEDAAQSLGSKYKEKYTGTIGDIGCFSFNGNKIITTGSGGMLVTDNEEFANHAFYLSNQAKDPSCKGQFCHSEVGYNYRMSSINAAVGLAQIKDIGRRIQIKKRISASYDEKLKLMDHIVLPCRKDCCETVFWLYPLLVKDESSMSELIDQFTKKGIETRPFFMPLHFMKPYSYHRHVGLNNTEYIYRHGVNLPSALAIDDQDINKVCQVISNVKKS